MINFFIQTEVGPRGPRAPVPPNGLQFGQGANAIWEYGAPALFTFKPDIRAHPEHCLCLRWRIVQIVSSIITFTPRVGPPSVEMHTPSLDAPKDQFGGDPHFTGQIEPGPDGEVASFDFPGVRSPWTITNPDGSRKYPKGAMLDVEFHFTTWVLCPVEAIVGTAQIQGAVKWTFTLHLDMGNGPGDTTQSILPGRPVAEGFTVDDPELQPDLAIYRLLLANYPDYLP